MLIDRLKLRGANNEEKAINTRNYNQCLLSNFSVFVCIKYNITNRYD